MFVAKERRQGARRKSGRERSERESGIEICHRESGRDHAWHDWQWKGYGSLEHDGHSELREAFHCKVWSGSTERLLGLEDLCVEE